MKKILIFCVIVLCAVSLTMNACSQKKKPQINKTVPVAVAAVTLKTIPVQINAFGSVEAFQSISVRSQTSGQIEKVFFKEGQDVNKGDLLLRLDCRVNQAALAQAQANLIRDKAQAKYAQEQLRRYTDLIKKDFVARDQYDQIKANAEALESTVKADQAIVENNRVQVEFCSIYSPINGRTGMLKADQGNVIKANDTELLTINQIQPINVTFSISEKDLARVKKYSSDKRPAVQAYIPGDDRPENGELTFIDNSIDKTTGAITLKSIFANKDKRLVPGQFVNVVMTLASAPDSILVPSQSIEQGQAGQFVYVIRPDQTAEMRPVSTGEETGGETVIVKGLKPGELVVTDGALRLTPGAKVSLKNQKNNGSQ